MTSANPASGTSVPASRSAPSLEELGEALDALRCLLASTPESPAACLDLYVNCIDLLQAVDERIRELAPEAEITPAQLESVCILLGPYRNLTTLTCAVLALHPQCVVLNHAALRVLPNPRLNFLADRSPERFTEFVRYAGFAARGGVRGPRGGDIRLSHAFEFEPMRRAEARLAGSRRGPAKCLVWKDSQRVTNFLRAAAVDVQALLARNAKLRFMLPVRNPIDCAISNLKTGHYQLLPASHRLTAASPVEDVVGAVLDEIAWFVSLRETSARPERFFLFFEHEMGRGLLEKMVAFLGLPSDEAYLGAAAGALGVAGGRRKDARVVARYAQQVQEKFGRYPELRDGLLRFAEGH